MILLGIDVGTTHLKAGAFDLTGAAQQIATRAMITHRLPDGPAYFSPQEVWEQAASALQEVTAGITGPVAAIGITSMAETGLLIDRKTGRARSEMLPWFDTAAQPQAAALAARVEPQAFFIKTGLQPSYKCSLAKLLWLRQRDVAAFRDAVVWLSAADYIAYRLTGVFATDYSLASRTCAFNIARLAWDEAWLAALALPAAIFPPAFPAGTPAGTTTAAGEALGLPPGIPVAVCGHDHVCGAFAAGASRPGTVFDSMGTAEALIGALPARPLTAEDYAAGPMVGCHTVSGSHYWMGGLSTSGGAIEWLRAQLGPTPLSYAELMALLDSAPAGPTGILFFPYLLGSSSPHRDPHAPGAWIGLRASHTRADLAKAVLEGTAYE
ncbi:MAG: carbohydrate kinase, partial [Anaerolineae bacterium]|nr:carbohydrate kinase [Anaerolineae bacterium]